MSRRPTAPRTPLRERLVPETVRSLVPTAVAIVLSAAAAAVLFRPLGIDGSAAPMAAGLFAWIVWSVVYCVLTCVAFAGRRGSELARVLRHAYPDRRGRAGTWLVGGSSAAWSVQFALMALLVGFALAQGVAWATTPAITVLGIAVIVVSWVSVLVSYSVHYARRDLAAGDDGGFRFPGAGPRAYADYVYLAAGVSTTFSTADVSVLDTVTRRMVTTHTIVAFAFSAVIVALVVVVLVNA